jgi:hypothetical protein
MRLGCLDQDAFSQLNRQTQAVARIAGSLRSSTRTVSDLFLFRNAVFPTAAYHASAEGGLNALGTGLAIKWPLDVGVLSDRDRKHPMIANEREGFLEESGYAKHH